MIFQNYMHKLVDKVGKAATNDILFGFKKWRLKVNSGKISNFLHIQNNQNKICPKFFSITNDFLSNFKVVAEIINISHIVNQTYKLLS